MILRPVDPSGDILPVLSSADLLRDTEAVAQLVRYRLTLPAGDWWENPAWGNEILERLRESRLTEADRQALSSYLSSYIRETPGVRDVANVRFTAEGRRLSWSWEVLTEEGEAVVSYETTL